MGSRVGDFFAAKKGWSRIKDSLLEHYLEPYVPKVATLGKPVVIVDCFAGAGRFADGLPGSPLIIAPIVKRWRDKDTNIRAEFIEADPSNFRRLQESLIDHRDHTEAHHGTFENHLGRLADLAKKNTLFLYVDPYTVRPLVFAKMKGVFDQIRWGASVEVLLNLNVPTFMRWGRAAISRYLHENRAELDEDETEGADYLADDPNENVEMSELDAIAGGDYWRRIARDPATFPQRVELFTAEYLKRLTDSFAFVAGYPVRDKYEHKVPKYELVFGTRNEHGFELMSDKMSKTRKEFLGATFREDNLFDLTPEHEIGDPDKLAKDILEILADGKPLTRQALRVKALPRHFCLFETKEINAVIGDLLRRGKLHSSKGKPVINDKDLLSIKPFASPPSEGSAVRS